jgi:release factor H-coupled RctB family protein
MKIPYITGESMDNKIKIVRSEKSWIESNAVEQLKKVSELKGIIKAVGLPDLHMGKTPVGASYITKDIIYPHIIGNEIGCGMALFSTGIKKNKFKLDKIVKKLKNISSIENIDISNYIKDLDMPFKGKLGTIGSGNHFSELQEICHVYDEGALEKIGVKKNNIYLLVHSGSRSYGEYILRYFIEKHSCQKGLESGSEAFIEYFSQHNKAVEYSVMNRELIAHRILSAINGKENVKLLDSIHNGISIKNINGQEYYIHRKGAAPSDIGCVVIAGTRGSKSYIVKPIDDLFEYAYSISHGAGRKWSRFGCKEKLEKIYLKKDLKENCFGENLICREKKLIFEEAPEAYKNIDRVIQDMLDCGMIKLVASLNPLMTYKM